MLLNALTPRVQHLECVHNNCVSISTTTFHVLLFTYGELTLVGLTSMNASEVPTQEGLHVEAQKTHSQFLTFHVLWFILW